jgi:L-lactate dehydrogenase complex protein LldG
LILDDDKTSDRLAALSPWVHVAVLYSEEIHRTIPEAIAALGDSPNIIWATGPSKTADVEGILIEGVHGPGEQIALLMD